MKFTHLTISVLVVLCLSLRAQPLKPGSYPPEVESTLRKAKGNRRELELFLEYARMAGDSLKWRAACFLVANMDAHFSETYYWADASGRRLDYDERLFSDYSTALRAFDSLKKAEKIHPVITLVPDVEQVKCSLLTDNLNRAFAAWQSPQARHLDFAEFCEYILPYRNLSEALEPWRPVYAGEFAAKDDARREKLPFRQALNLFNDKLRGYFAGSFSYEGKNCPVSYLAPSQLLFRRRGHCEDMVNFATLACRSQGIPCRTDVTPYHATSTGRHYWNATLDEDHRLVSFEGAQDKIENFTLRREPSKVITVTYAKQPDALASILPLSEIPDNYLRITNYRDVTDQYWRVADIPCRLRETLGKRVAYVAVFNGMRWQAAFWGTIRHDKTTVFPKMACGAAYLPMLYDKGKLVPAAPVMVLDNQKQTHLLLPDKSRMQTVTMEEEAKYLKFRKGKVYKLFYWDGAWKPAGQQTAADEPRLHFEGVPANALYLLLPEYSAGKERPFYLAPDGKRVWL